MEKQTCEKQRKGLLCAKTACKPRANRLYLMQAIAQYMQTETTEVARGEKLWSTTGV